MVRVRPFANDFRQLHNGFIKWSLLRTRVATTVFIMGCVCKPHAHIVKVQIEGDDRGRWTQANYKRASIRNCTKYFHCNQHLMMTIQLF
jgi:hypothetical protein